MSIIDRVYWKSIFLGCTFAAIASVRFVHICLLSSCIFDYIRYNVFNLLIFLTTILAYIQNIQRWPESGHCLLNALISFCFNEYSIQSCNASSQCMPKPNRQSTVAISCLSIKSDLNDNKSMRFLVASFFFYINTKEEQCQR